MILHLVHDEKFVDMGVRVFEEVYPGQNECIVLSYSSKLKFIKSTPCVITNIDEVNIKKLAKSFKKYDAIVIHGLDFNKLRVLRFLPKNIVTVWLGFGFDYYDLIYQNNTDLFCAKTKKMYMNLHPNCGVNKNNEHILIKSFKRIKHLIFRVKTKKELLQKITYFSPVLNKEYDMVKYAMRNDFTPKFLDWNYGTLEDDLIRGYENTTISSNNILLGNSASYENNHLDVFDLLIKHDLQNRKIIVPLSYGKSEYRNYILKEGELLFHNHFVPLVNFMSIDEYINLIRSCSVVIMNHIRQQAVGNVITMMYVGAVIILNRQSPLFQFFKEEGAIVYSIDELQKKPKILKMKLSYDEKEKNRYILKKHWSRGVAQKKTRDLINTVVVG